MKLPSIPHTPFVIVLAALAALAFGYILRMPVADAQTSNCPPGSRQPGEGDPEVIVSTTPVKLPALCARRGMAIQNNGASNLWCTITGVSAHARVGRSWKIAAGDSWSFDAKDTLPIYCVAESAQAQGAATVVMELR